MYGDKWRLVRNREFYEYRAYTKEWCGNNKLSLLKPHHSFVYALYIFVLRVKAIYTISDLLRRMRDPVTSVPVKILVV
jgi:hypothetical protein